MNFNNPIPRSGLPKFHEASPQRSLRDSDATARQWKRNEDTTRQLEGLAKNVQNIQRQIHKMRRRSAAEDESSLADVEVDLCLPATGTTERYKLKGEKVSV